LARMDRHERDSVLAPLPTIDVAEDRRHPEEASQPAVRLVADELARGVHELVEVEEPILRIVLERRSQVLAIAGLIEDRRDELFDGRALERFEAAIHGRERRDRVRALLLKLSLG